MKPDPNGRVRSLIAGNCTLYHVAPESLPKRIGMSRTTFYHRMKNPESFTAFELRRLADIMHRTNDDKAAVI